MSDPIVARILNLPGYGVYQHAFDEAAQTVTCWVRPDAATPYCCCPQCGISTQATVGHPTERRVRDLPWGPWQVWLVASTRSTRVPCRGVDDIPAGRARSADALEQLVLLVVRGFADQTRTGRCTTPLRPKTLR